MWEINNSLQTVCFLRSLVLGAALSFFYDVFSALRKTGINSDFAVFIQDIIFFTIASPVVFLFLLATTNGEIRLYVLLGIIIGFFIFKLLISKVFVFLLSKFFGIIFLALVYINRGFKGFYRVIDGIFRDFLIKTAYFFKKSLKYFKKGLKKQE